MHTVRTHVGNADDTDANGSAIYRGMF